MPQKPEIQYVEQFYVYGSEAQKLQLKKKRDSRTVLPLKKLEQLDRVYIDTVALVGIAVAIFMLAVMLIGIQQLRADRAEYENLRSYVSELNRKNEELTQAYRASYNLTDIENKALGQGMIPKNDAQSVIIYVTVPQKPPKPTRWDYIRQFWEGLFA